MSVNGRVRFIPSWVPIFATIISAGCGGGGELTVPPTTGTVEIATSTTGNQTDADGYLVQMDAEPAQTIGSEGTVTVSQVSPGNHIVHLGEVAGNCAVALNPITVAVEAGEVSNVNFTITCGSTSGGITVTATTGGTAPDIDGYSLLIDGADRGPLGVNAEVQVGDLTPGSHVVGLGGLAANCLIEGDNLRVVPVTAGATASVAYAINCVAPPAGAGSLRIRTETSGGEGDPDGYTVVVDGGEAQPIGSNATSIIANLAPGAHTVQLAGVAENCSVQGPNPQSVTVIADASTGITFVIDCRATVGGLQVTTTSTGQDLDPDGYQFSVDGGPGRPIGTSGSATVSNLLAGNHTVQLSGVASNCSVNDAAQTATVTAGNTAAVAFAITCTAIPPATGSIRVTTSTSGEDRDDGYQFTIDNGTPHGIAASGDETIANIAAGNHTVELTGVAGNCSVNDASQSVTVTPGTTATAAFVVTCTAIPPAAGSIRVTTRTSGADPDDTYQFSIDDGTGRSIGPNTSEDVGSVSPGNHTVELSGVAGNCSVDDDAQTVTVTPGNTATVTFTITCTAIPPAVGSIRVTTNTGGEDEDTDGYQFSIDGGQSQPIGTDGSQTITDVPTGSHTVVISGIAENCDLAGDASRTVIVTEGDREEVDFAITCTSTAPPEPSASQSTVVADPKTIPTGGSSTITVTVNDASGDPIGGVAVSLSSTGSGDITPGSATTNASGEATFTFSSTDAGDKTIIATAGGVTLNDTEVITVFRRSSTTEITSITPEPSTSGESITVTVAVTSESGTPTGTVAITSEQEAAGCDAAPISEGVATCDFVLAVTGTHTISAAYSGDDAFDGSADREEHLVNEAPTP